MDTDNKHDMQRRAFIKASLCALTGAVAVGSGLGVPANALAATMELQPTPTAPMVVGYSNGSIGMERVTFPNRNLGTKVVGNLFKPAGFDAGKKYPAIVVTHPFGGVKEQTSGLYALKLAEQGFVTLAYDASYQGESGGEPRLMEVPAARLGGISSAIDFLSNHPRSNRTTSDRWASVQAEATPSVRRRRNSGSGLSPQSACSIWGPRVERAWVPSHMKTA